METKHILIVEDSVAVREFLSELLQNRGYVTTEACSGEEAMALINEHFFHLLITDLHMPGMDGLELIRTLRATNIHRHLPIIVLSSESNPDIITEVKLAGATGWFNKTVGTIDIIRVIRRLIG